MQLLMVFLFKKLRLAKLVLIIPLHKVLTWMRFYTNGIVFSSFRSRGVPKVAVHAGGKCVIGKSFKMNNYVSANPIGRVQACSFFVGKTGELVIGENVGMSSSAIFCQKKIVIGDNVNLGGNVVIYDTDFHSLSPTDRLNRKTDIQNAKSEPVEIRNNAFIGAHSTILKGVVIGENAVVGACSVVTKNIPANQIWAGNPAKFIRSL